MEEEEIRKELIDERIKSEGLKNDYQRLLASYVNFVEESQENLKVAIKALMGYAEIENNFPREYFNNIEALSPRLAEEALEKILIKN